MTLPPSLWAPKSPPSAEGLFFWRGVGGLYGILVKAVLKLIGGSPSSRMLALANELFSLLKIHTHIA